RANPDKPAAAPETRDRARADQQAMRGTWTRSFIESYVQDGTPGKRPRKLTYVIDGDRIAMLGDDGLVSAEWTFRLDPGARPAGIDLVSRQTGSLLGIYQIEGDLLRICFGSEDGKRAPEFPPTGDENCWQLKRVSTTLAPAVARFASAPGCYWMIEPTNPP